MTDNIKLPEATKAAWLAALDSGQYPQAASATYRPRHFTFAQIAQVIREFF